MRTTGGGELLTMHGWYAFPGTVVVESVFDYCVEANSFLISRV